MYIGIYALLFVITIVAGKRIYRSLLNPISIWASWWSIVGIMANLTLFEYYAPSDYVNIVIILGILIYLVYACIYGLAKKKRWKLPQRSEYIDEFFNYKLLFLVNFIAIAIELPFFFKALSTLGSNSFKLDYLRGILTDAQEGIVSGGLISIIRDSGVKNIYSLTMIYAAILLFSNAPSKRKRQVLALALFEVTEYSITNAARIYVVNFIFYVLFALLFFKRKSILQMLKKYRKYASVLVILVVVLLALNQSRAGDMSIMRTVYMYYFSGPSYLSRLIEDSSVSITIGKDLHWGTMTFGFLANIYYYIKIALTGINDSTVKLLASVISIKQYHVGARTYLNAMCTCFYPFLADWGNAGVVIGSMVTAVLGCRYYGKMKEYMDIGSVALCIYVFYALFNTVFKWYFLYIDFTVVLILNYLICPRKGQKFVVGKIRSNYVN